ncbi:15680_t:CDS:2, partial [Dentiscutata erythropus]
GIKIVYNNLYRDYKSSCENAIKIKIFSLQAIEQKFIRFNSNDGFIKNYRPTLEAFVHFTHEETGGYLIITDLQGIELKDKFILTDPAIHCTDFLRFGRTNLGIEGINRCLLTKHKCNGKKLGLPYLG